MTSAISSGCEARRIGVVSPSAVTNSGPEIRYRLQQIATKTGHDPRTFAGLVELLCVLEITSRA